MKLITKILGKVNEYNEPPQLSYVTLVDTDTGKIHFTDAVSEKLKEKGITYPIANSNSSSSKTKIISSLSN